MRNERSIWLTEQTGDLLGSMVLRNIERAQDALDLIAEKEGTAGVFMACYGAAEITRRMKFPHVRRGDGSLNQSHMMAVLPDPKANVPAKYLWAAQFFAAYCNGDDATAHALFHSTIDDPQAHAGGVVTMLMMCADVVRDHLLGPDDDEDSR